METKILLKNESLWDRIQGFSLENPNATFPFSKKLAKEEKWTSDFTQRAIEEYKKFVYLCCISPNGASPSEVVDKVWHLHLIYTQNYWEEFCPNILKQNLHHHPSNGGFDESNKHNNWFSETLENYKAVFVQEAPEDIWKKQEEKARPRYSWKKNLRLFYLVLPFLIYSCSSAGAGSVLKIIIILLISFIVLMVILLAIFGRLGNNGKNDSNASSDGSSSGGSCSGGGSSCSGGCGSGCGGCGGG